MNFIETNVNGLPLGMADGFGPGVHHGFSTRLGGVSKEPYAALNLGLNRGDDRSRVEENFGLFCAAVGVEREKLVFSAQVHADAVRICTSADAGVGLDRPAPYEADALVTDVPGLALAVFTADCLPILLYDGERRVVAAVHAGWRGTALGIVERTVERMAAQYGSDRANILAAIGTGISRCCFETREDVPNAMTESLGAAALPFIEAKEGGRFLVDLKGLNVLRLERAGLRAANVAVSNACTACLPQRYWSHRAAGDQRGSMAAVISLV
ncbi:MAG TPA: peptidoglycan editing factor PgeF [Pseudoflavonifractor sp.]|nr:peptidoglycan editing factor PgeF [Pseudoflavonifractor sp.]